MGRKLDQPSRETCDIVDKRDDWSCTRCGKSLYAVVGARHHRKLRSQASKEEKHTAANLIDVCETCHEWIHANPALAYEHGLMVHGFDDPREVPIDHAKWGTCYLWNDGTVATIPETLSAMGGARIEYPLGMPVKVYEDGTWEMADEE